MIPRNKPTTEAMYETKFIKNVDWMTWITMRSGKTTPITDRMNPININWTGLKRIIFRKASKPLNVRAQARNQAVPLFRTNP